MKINCRLYDIKIIKSTGMYMNVLKIILILVVTVNTWAKQVSHGVKEKSVSPEQSFNLLVDGNKRFLESKIKLEGQSAADVQRLSSGQKPHAIVLSCSDSRVPPEIVFDQKLGEIFVVRTAGETLGDNAIGSIEYAIEHLGSKLIVVMGHTSCGAVKAAHSTLDGSSAGTPALDNLVKDIHPRIKKYKGKEPSTKYTKESWSNTEGVSIELVKRSKLIREKVKSGEVRIVPSLYDLDTGLVAFRTIMKTKNSTAVEIRVPASTKSQEKLNHGH
jgi:carbonic anhydrase